MDCNGNENTPQKSLNEDKFQRATNQPLIVLLLFGGVQSVAAVHVINQQRVVQLS